MHDLRIALPGKIISVAVPVAPQYHFIDPVALSREVDLLFVMAYDIEGAWSGYAGHNAPLYRNNKMPQDLSIATLIEQQYLNVGVPPSKVILGFPLYGRKFQTSQPYGTAYSSEIVNYRDLPFASCARVFDAESQVPYLSCGSYYISYDDTESLAAKVSYAKLKNLGGIFMWALGADGGKIIEKLPIAS